MHFILYKGELQERYMLYPFSSKMQITSIIFCHLSWQNIWWSSIFYSFNLKPLILLNQTSSYLPLSCSSITETSFVFNEWTMLLALFFHRPYNLQSEWNFDTRMGVRTRSYRLCRTRMQSASLQYLLKPEYFIRYITTCK